ncbi:MAG: ABC transporter substrate-binding protein [Rhodospirillales bacterium]|nr:ABC transporter substrate-binding protein [Rhodospirillales bacterium]
MILKLFKTFVVTSLAAILLISVNVKPAKANSIPESDDPIKLAIYEWTGQHIASYIAGHILEDMGYNVEYVTAGTFPSAFGLSDGNLTATMEIWDNNLGDFWPKMLEEGKIEDIGAVGLDAREGWLYPLHVKDDCPGLPSWEALQSCAGVFADAETFPKGRFVEYPADWSDRATRLIQGEGLAFETIPAGSEGALVAELKASVQKKKPLVMMFWAPHWSLAEIETEWVEIPQELLDKYSLQIPRVFKAAWPGLKDKWPTAYKFLKVYQLNNQIQQVLMNKIDNEGQDPVKATKAWVDSNKDYWEPMVDKATSN